MAITNTSATTSTKTSLRMDLLKSQIRIALWRLIPEISDSDLDTIERGVENKWIEYVLIYVIDDSELCYGELCLRIDWNTHNIEIEKGHTTVTFEKKVWKDDTAPEINGLIPLFREYVNTHKCKTIWRVRYASSVDESKINAELGLRNAGNLEWKSGERVPVREKNIHELVELTIKGTLVEV